MAKALEGIRVLDLTRGPAGGLATMILADFGAEVVVIDAPSGAEYYGGEVAAPVFSRVIDGAMRILDVEPDDISPLMHANQELLIDQGSRG